MLVCGAVDVVVVVAGAGPEVLVCYGSIAGVVDLAGADAGLGS